MDAAQKTQLLGHETLRAQAEAVHPDLAQRPEPGPVHRARVCLAGDLRVRGQAKGVAYRLQDQGQVLGGEDGGGAAPQEDGARGRVPAAFSLTADVRSQRAGKAAVQILHARVGVEITVRALALAERNVDVDAEGRAHHSPLVAPPAGTTSKLPAMRAKSVIRSENTSASVVKVST